MGPNPFFLSRQGTYSHTAEVERAFAIDFRNERDFSVRGWALTRSPLSLCAGRADDSNEHFVGHVVGVVVLHEQPLIWGQPMNSEEDNKSDKHCQGIRGKGG